jgi:chemotaxis signal transduction protein
MSQSSMSQAADTRTPAWLLDCGAGVRVAVALPSLLHLIDDRTLLHRVPQVPRHFGQVLLWQQRVFPVVDLTLQMGARAPATNDSAASGPALSGYVCLLGWCDAQQCSDYGGVLVRELPRRIQIADQSFATPTQKLAAQWAGLALTYFDFHGHVVPIIAPAALFEPAARTERAASSAQAPQHKDTRRV